MELHTQGICIDTTFVDNSWMMYTVPQHFELTFQEALGRHRTQL